MKEKSVEITTYGLAPPDLLDMVNNPPKPEKEAAGNKKEEGDKADKTDEEDKIEEVKKSETKKRDEEIVKKNEGDLIVVLHTF